MNICKFACSFRASAVVFSCTLQNPRFIRCSVRLKPISHSDRKRDFFRRIKINKISERCWRIPPLFQSCRFFLPHADQVTKSCAAKMSTQITVVNLSSLKINQTACLQEAKKPLMSLVPKRCQIHCKLRLSKFAEVQKRNRKSNQIGSLLGFKNYDCTDI